MIHGISYFGFEGQYTEIFKQVVT